jgi:ABC-type multidrug transport system ATPase subunit
MIEIKNLHKVYKSKNQTVHALKGIDLKIENGMYGLLGPNGAGKTTLMRILAGIINPTDGEIVINGINIRTEEGKRKMKAMLGYLPQELGLYPDLTAREFIDYLAILKGVDNKKNRQNRIEHILELVSLTDVADRKIKGYSGGMKRRVGIAQALVNDPKILIVDEPTAGLDPEERIKFRNLLVNLATNRIVLLSTHIVGDIGQTCQRLAVLVNGRLKYEGDPITLTNQAKGHVWSIESGDGTKPDHDLTVVSMQHMPNSTHYRVVGETVSQYPQAKIEEPSLEDAYMWLMKTQNK